MNAQTAKSPTPLPAYDSGLLLLGILGLFAAAALVMVALLEGGEPCARLLLALIGFVWGMVAIGIMLVRLVLLRLDGIVAALKAGPRP